MNIEIVGINFYNKGAELMLLTLENLIKDDFKGGNICLNLNSGNYFSIRNKGYRLVTFRFSSKLPFIGKLLNSFCKILPPRVREILGLVLIEEIDLILDASGFLYSDQWGKSGCENAARYYESQKHRQCKIVLLPQAFGPFELKENLNAFRRMLKNVNLGFARDRKSYDHILKAAPNEIFKIKISGDFTNLVNAQFTNKYQKYKDFILVVPNYRMLDKKNKDSYLNYLVSVTDWLCRNKMKFAFLIHELDKDYNIYKRVSKSIRGNIDCIKESNPLIIKGIIGNSKLLIASRYHSIVNALNQGVPVIATGWSHKYKLLMQDYNLSFLLIDEQAEDHSPELLLANLLNDESYRNLKARISLKAAELKKHSEQMWQEVKKLAN